MANRPKKGQGKDREQQDREGMGKTKPARGPEEIGTTKGRGQDRVERPASEEADFERWQEDQDLGDDDAEGER